MITFLSCTDQKKLIKASEVQGTKLHDKKMKCPQKRSERALVKLAKPSCLNESESFFAFAPLVKISECRGNLLPIVFRISALEGPINWRSHAAPLSVVCPTVWERENSGEGTSSHSTSKLQ